MIYGEKLRTLRERSGLVQADLAKILSINKDVYGQYEREYVIMPIKHLNTICNYFNVSLDYAFNFVNNLTYDNISQDIDKILISKRLKELRKENNLTLKKLGEILNVSYGTIAGYEIGRYLIATPFLYDICKKYKISADYLLGKIDEPKYLK